MNTRVPAKSILKQSSQPAQVELSDEAVLKAAQDKKHLNIALQHAYLMQHQRDLSSQILAAIETLLDFPATSIPTSDEAKQFVDLASHLQPLNVDELVEERQIDRKCGYALCAKEPRSRSLGEAAKWKLGEENAAFCSKLCKQKTKFVQAQLLETPAWERIPGQQPALVLHEADRHLLPDIEPRIEHHQVQQKVADRDELAMERGEAGTSFRPNQVMTDMIVEKTPSTGKARVASKVKFASATAVEGYEPKTKTKTKKSGKDAATNDDDDNDDDDSSDDDDAFDGLGSGVFAPEVLPLLNADEEQTWRDLAEHSRG
jgi:hypothetical protein